MSDTLQIIGAAMQTDSTVVRVISQNIANAQTTAYQREVAVAHLDFDQLVDNHGAPAFSAMTPQLEIVRDQHPGTLRATNDPLHAAIDGPGFFMLQGAHGVALTRRGDFHLGADGTLLAANGVAVLGESGPLQVVGANPTIALDGTVRVNGETVDRIRIGNIADAAKLTANGDGSYTIDADQIIEAPGTTRLRQGFLETSNVSPVNELIQLMDTVRRFEAEQHYARAYDGLLDKAISELGKAG